MSGTATTEAAGRQDGQGVKGNDEVVLRACRLWVHERYGAWESASFRVVEFFASPEGQAALAAFRGDSPALGPSSPPPPPSPLPRLPEGVTIDDIRSTVGVDGKIRMRHGEYLLALIEYAEAHSASSPPPPSREEQIKEAAAEAAERLFTVYRGKKVDRLRMEEAGEVTAGYWTERYAADCIASALRSCWPSEGDGGEGRREDGRVECPTRAGKYDRALEFADEVIRLCGWRESMRGEENRVYACLKRLFEHAAALASERDAADARAKDWKRLYDMAASEQTDDLIGRVASLEGEIAAAREAQAAAEREWDERQISIESERRRRRRAEAEGDRLQAELDKANGMLAALLARPASLPPLPEPNKPGEWLVMNKGESSKVICVRDPEQNFGLPGDRWYCLDDLFAPSPPASPAPADALYCPPPLFVTPNP